jgi:hypothetical protein
LTGKRPKVGVAGFRVKSGVAVAVLVAGSRRSPEVLQRGEVELCPAGDPEARQPYHAGFGALETDKRLLAARITAIRRTAAGSVRSMVSRWREQGIEVRAAALVVGSLKPPEAIANEHIRAHALEGRLFRTVLAEALAASDLRAAAIEERHVYGEAASALAMGPDALRATVGELGRSIGKPWKADHKLAALAAWSRLPR